MMIKKIFGKEIIDENAIQQLENCLIEDSIGVLTADAHLGYSHPIGGAIAYKNFISMSGVGFDIGCGNYCVRTDIEYKSLAFKSKNEISKIMDEIFKKISFGMGRDNNDNIDHEVLEKISKSNLEFQKDLAGLASRQLGTVGGGNHFVDLFRGDDDFIWIGVHFGSRGFGHKTTTYFMNKAEKKEGDMNAPPILFHIDSWLGQAYIESMKLAGEYAYAGREIVVNKVLEILGNPKVTFSVHNHHNFAWLENHFGEDYWVVRKGCTPAFPNQKGFIGANMKDTSFIVEGVDSEESKDGLYSTVHGAGRILSRRKAKGKTKFQKFGKKRIEVQISGGLVDFDNTKDIMKSLKIELRGAGADESFECYKNLEEVLKYQGNTIKILHKLQPIGVAMAGGDVYDPYKD